MDVYLGTQGSVFYPAVAAPTSSQDLDPGGLLDRAASSSLLQHGNAPVKLDRATSEVTKDLKTEIQGRLVRLQQTLCI